MTMPSNLKEVDMSRLLRTGAALAAVIAAATVSIPLAPAQEKYPSRPVKVILPLPAGQSADVGVRIVADQLGKIWGQQVVVENRPGGALSVGVQAAIAAPADGYTLLAAPASVYTILPMRKDKLAFDVNRDLTPIGTTAYEGFMIVVSPKLGVNTLGDLIALANKEPGKIVIGTSGTGSGPHLVAQRLADISKATMTVLPYATGGTAAAITDVLGGRVHVAIDTRSAFKGALDSGDLKALAILARERVPSLPDLPTAAETVPGLTAVGWIAIAAPKGTPEWIVRQLAEDLRKAVEAPETQARRAPFSLPFRPLFGAELTRFIEAEQELWRPMVKATLGPK
jgi:tripartite-type tricarboxylate transporter receptor subunit TctC